jgi:AraC-like DNA-binding protein
MNQVMSRYLNNITKLPKLTFVPISINGSNVSEKSLDLFAYFMYESQNNVYHKQSTFIVTLKPEWLFDNVNAINQLSEQSDSFILIMDGNGMILNPHESSMIDQSILQTNIKNHLAQSNQMTDSFILGTGTHKKYITYMNSEANNWRIVNVQNYQNVFGKVDKMRINSIWMIVNFILLSMFVSFVLSLKLYKPIENLLKLIKRTDHHEVDRVTLDTDEFSFISSEYKFARDNMEMLKRNHETKINILKTYHLRKLVTDSSIASLHEIQEEYVEGRLKIDLTQRMLLIVLKFDNYLQYSKNKDDFEKKMHKFAIINIAQEIISRRFAENEFVDMKSDHLVFLLNIHEQTRELKEELIALLKYIQHNILKYYGISLTVSISELIDNYLDITKSYGQALEYSNYRLIYGKMMVITSEMVRVNQSNAEFQFAPEMEKRLIESIKANDLKQVREVLSDLMRYLSTLSYHNITYSLRHLIVIVTNVVREINNGNINQISIDLQHLYTVVMEQESLEEIHLLLTDLMLEIHEKRKNMLGDSKNQILVDAIKEIIEQNYGDLNLNLQSISTTMKMSTSHISKIFKNKESISVTDYITEVRLNHSLILLEKKDSYSIGEIAEKIGFGSQSYFFKLFKKRFGTTPKEYRIKKVIH